MGEEFGVAEMGMPSRFSRGLRCKRLLNGNAGLSGDMALRIEKAFGVKMGTLMRMV